MAITHAKIAWIVPVTMDIPDGTTDAVAELDLIQQAFLERDYNNPIVLKCVERPNIVDVESGS
jgi:hypothetical protein